MKRSEQEQLLGELLDSERLTEVRGSSLELGLAHLRRRRQRERVMRGLLVAAVPLALLLVVLLTPTSPRRVLPVKVASSAVTAASTPVKFITDDELLALFPGRSLALVGKPGQQQLVFLDQRSARR